MEKLNTRLSYNDLGIDQDRHVEQILASSDPIRQDYEELTKAQKESESISIPKAGSEPVVIPISSAFKPGESINVFSGKKTEVIGTQGTMFVATKSIGKPKR